MSFKDKDRAHTTLKYISYYRIKDFAAPFTRNNPIDGNVDFNGVYFEDIIARYYRDKNLRQYLLHALEDIEVALQVQIGTVLGEKGDYYYSSFNNWVDKSRSKKTVIELETSILKDINTSVNKSQSIELSKKMRETDEKYPPVWLAMNELMFGKLIKILELMGNKNLKKIANFFNCSTDQLLSWMRCLNLVRNLSAHNSNLIDFRLRTQPKIKYDWKPYLYVKDSKYSNDRLSIILIIIVHFLVAINPKYRLKDIKKSYYALLKNNNLDHTYYGFREKNSFNEFISQVKQ